METGHIQKNLAVKFYINLHYLLLSKLKNKNITINLATCIGAYHSIILYNLYLTKTGNS